MVTWTKDEEEIVVWNAIRLIEKNKFNIFEAIQQAQKNMLPNNRQRVIKGQWQVSKIIKKINDSLDMKEVSEIKEIKKKVMIVGLHKNQEIHIKKEFENKFDLNFQETDANIYHMQEKAKNIDKIVLVTKSISHLISYALDDLKKFEYCNGSISSLKTILDNL